MTPEELRAKRLAAKKADYYRNREKRLAQQREYRAANAELIRQRDRERFANHTPEQRERHLESGRKWAAENKDKVRARTQRWLEANADRKRETNRQWKLRNPDKVMEQGKEWWASNKEKGREYAQKRTSTPRGKLEASVRSGIYSRLSREAGRKGKARTFDLLGYTVEDLVNHLERQFTKGMSWFNYGEWHVDHIVPVSSFNYETFHDPEFRSAWALSNLRPLWGRDNYSKGAKRHTLL